MWWATLLIRYIVMRLNLLSSTLQVAYNLQTSWFLLELLNGSDVFSNQRRIVGGRLPVDTHRFTRSTSQHESETCAVALQINLQLPQAFGLFYVMVITVQTTLVISFENLHLFTDFRCLGFAEKPWSGIKRMRLWRRSVNINWQQCRSSWQHCWQSYQSSSGAIHQDRLGTTGEFLVVVSPFPTLGCKKTKENLKDSSLSKQRFDGKLSYKKSITTTFFRPTRVLLVYQKCDLFPTLMI